ncbi:hypothetical protein Dimus_036838, partial [Dionaea muscipula]
MPINSDSPTHFPTLFGSPLFISFLCTLGQPSIPPTKDPAITTNHAPVIVLGQMCSAPFTGVHARLRHRRAHPATSHPSTPDLLSPAHCARSASLHALSSAVGAPCT